jgi:hypothetical protein
MLPDYAKSKEFQNMSSIKSLIAMTRVTQTAPIQSESTPTVACFGSQSFTASERGSLQAEARCQFYETFFFVTDSGTKYGCLFVSG